MKVRAGSRSCVMKVIRVYNRGIEYAPRDAETSRGSKLKGLAHMNKYTPVRPANQLPNGDIEITLTRGFKTIISPEDIDLASSLWCSSVAKGKTYAMRNHTKTKLHNIILSRILNRELNENEQADHVDGNSLNNTRSNLRLSNQYLNSKNRRINSNSTTGFKGVSKSKDKYMARIKVNYKTIWLGRFNTPEEAYNAYCEASKKYHGEFGRIE